MRENLKKRTNHRRHPRFLENVASFVETGGPLGAPRPYLLDLLDTTLAVQTELAPARFFCRI